MTDLYKIIREFCPSDVAQPLYGLDQIGLTVSDILSLEEQDIAIKANIPVTEIQKVKDSLVNLLHTHLNSDFGHYNKISSETGSKQPVLRRTGHDLTRRWQCISGLDSGLNTILNDGIPCGYLTEICGESGTGKTQLLLMLMLSVQLASPHGLESSALYLSTEAQLPTTRLHQILEANKHLSSLSSSLKPCLSRIFAISVPDLESLDHILDFQVPIAIRRFSIGLLVIDSVASCYRVEFSIKNKSTNGPAMARRALHLLDLAFRLRELAKIYNIAIVTTNQVTDNLHQEGLKVSSQPGLSSNRLLPLSCFQQTMIRPRSNRTGLEFSSRIFGQFILMTLDQQQNWLVGWREGLIATAAPRFFLNLKKPSLGFVWSNQIATRIILVKNPQAKGSGDSAFQFEFLNLCRSMKLVYSAWPNSASRTSLVSFIIENGGLLCLS